MPVFEGIEVSIVTRSEIGQLPEYPYPDGATDKLRKRDTSPLGKETQEDVAEWDQGDPLGGKSVVSVYVPSLPGAHFFIKYVVHEAPPPTCHLFFKLYMNGRHITSWGINTVVKSHGCTEKALYEPSDRWSREANGVVFKQQGIEARYFYFTDSREELSAAADGGLIEVQVFRAKGRRRRAAKLDQYRHQDNAPSGGLLDNPQSVTYFDFHLLDAKDAPFAQFRFHYRSWTNLRQLSLIPEQDINLLEASIESIPPSASDMLSNQASSALTAIESYSNSVDKDKSASNATYRNDSLDGTIENDAMAHSRSPFRMSSPVRFSSENVSNRNLPQPSKILRDAISCGIPGVYRERPLPDRPLPELADVYLKDSRAPHSRNCSTGSAAPSVAASLQSYANNMSLMDETIEYGQAREIAMNKEYPGVPLQDHKGSSSGCSTLKPRKEPTTNSSTESSLPATGTEVANLKQSPLTHSPHVESTFFLEQLIEHAEHDSLSSYGNGNCIPENPDSSKESTTRIKEDGGVDMYAEFAHLRPLQCTSKQRSSSPRNAPRGILSPRLGRLWNSIRRNKSRSPLRTLNQAPNSHNVARMPKNNTTPHFACPEVKERHGNWI
ncbi:hypothetical protein BD289DRAFT_61871 [Coniella lustricola]|uniref:Uncharacterized protein n=1 Tax=Coniella lustricola TaxID=2025994 RepID=A0A2T3A0J1_9PEZI|nr:hypothetical protein BD289DRAFT_61871 [Coniella lustricola]